MLNLMVSLVKTNNVTQTTREDFQKRPFNPLEMMILNAMGREELLAIMVFCEIRLMNEVPVVALTDDELKMAYVLWRSEGQNDRKRRRRTVKRKIKWVEKTLLELIERVNCV